MILRTMALFRIRHKTEYRYARPVTFGEHRIMLRPRDGHDLRVLDSTLDIVPQPMSLRWIHDVFGNSVAIATFDQRADTLTFDSHIIVDHKPAAAFTLTPDDPGYFYPFLYDPDENLDLLQYVTPHYADPGGELDGWARGFLEAEAPTPTFRILSRMTHGIREQLAYRAVEILRGLSEKEQVISSGQSDYQIGEIVKPKLVPGPAGAGEGHSGEQYRSCSGATGAR